MPDGIAEEARVNPVLLEIPVAPHGLNVLMRMNWVRRHKETKRWRRLVWVARCQKIVGRPTPFSHAKVTMTRISPKLLDEDNLYASAKMPLDALKCNELIVDDSPKHVKLQVTQQVGKAQLIIRIEEAELDSKQANRPTSVPCTSKPLGGPTVSVDAQ